MTRAVSASFLGACNPAVKLAVLTLCSAGVLFLTDPAVLAALCAALLLAVVLAGRVPPRDLARAMVPFLAFGVGTLLVNALARPGTLLWPDLPVRVTAEGVRIGAMLALRTLVIGTTAVVFAATTPPQRLLTSLVEHARVPPRVAFALLAGHRMLQTLPEQWTTIRRAHAVRAPLRRDGRPRFGPREYARCAFALLVTSIRAGERVAFALESRGLADGPRTIWRPTSLGVRDVALVGVVLGALGVAIGLS
ncbi:energy-coupling factor transporter transmembrane protein EcfT [Miniimonas sp. S16]|uniref:energy-coupling factor transporter transmembrane component T family protein n=1 Tax=Miniimonas sp. S16 TaxID=2171623 RepID=UPI000D5287E4|nr:energy-coupling factor transporter transmembrane component T [Miniimonas sp. S16]